MTSMRLADSEPARPVGGVDGGHHQAGRHHYQDQAGDPEEPGQVQLHAALVDAVADGRRQIVTLTGRSPGPARSKPVYLEV